ncbi:MAG TPA: FCD domain-containing protein [Rhodothermales bacterium]|nr:FCD domain-containing protein [Rhodothermales bacterium]
MANRHIVQLQVLEHLAQLTEPIGSGALRARLAAYGRPFSQPTIGRVLLQMDSLGVTAKLSNKGRLLTPEGRRYLEEARRRSASSQLTERQLASVGRATLLELRQALEARRVLEREAARLAALHASPDDVARLRSIVDTQRHSLPSADLAAHAAVDFHEVLAEASHNRFVASTLHLIRSSTQNIRLLMAALGVSIGGESIPHHVEIVEAIAARNDAAAESAAESHITEFVRYVDGWLSGAAAAADGGRRSERAVTAPPC